MEIEHQEVGDNNLIYCCTTFHYPKNQRQIAAAIINMDERQIMLSEFRDNEHFSNFESLLVQMNPSNSHTQFKFITILPDLTSEKDKVNDIISQCDIEPIQKSKKDIGNGEKLVEDSLNKLLEKPFKQYMIESNMSKALTSLACLFTVTDISQEPSNFQQFTLEIFVPSKFMKLDLAAINALLIFPKAQDQHRRLLMGSSETTFGTLVDLLDKCQTQIGSRNLRRWLRQPLQDPQEINKRLDMVEFLSENDVFRQFLQNNFLQKISDLDKLYAQFYKVHSQKRHNANLSDCIQVYQLVVNLKELDSHIRSTDMVDQIIQDNILEPLEQVLKLFEKYENMMEKAIDMEKAQKDQEYVVSPKFSSALNDLSKEINRIQKDIDNLKERVSQELGIDVKVVESNTHTFLFESKQQQADDAFRRLELTQQYQTITVRNRLLCFTTEKLQSLCVDFADQRTQYAQEQSTVVSKILDIVATYYPAMQKASSMISEIDTLASFAHVAATAPKKYVRPKINPKGSQMVLQNSRHPCLQMLLSSDNQVVSNDCELVKETSRLHIISGPNMGGQSTYIRQVATSVVLAHIGCFVPCDFAEIPIIDAVITRVGANDMQLRGISTFMSEMIEASCMLKVATENSLIIIDELGRGTSTSEGFGLAWAISEYIATEIKCFALFATHFQEITTMEKIIQGVKNYFVSCCTMDGKLTMQYKVKPGASERSYGLYVAELLQFPEEILKNASKKLLELETYQENDEEDDQEESKSKMSIEPSQKDKNKQSSQFNINDFLNISKNASLEQKEAVIKLAQNYTQKIQSASNQESKQATIDELKNKIVEILSN